MPAVTIPVQTILSAIKVGWNWTFAFFCHCFCSTIPVQTILQAIKVHWNWTFAIFCHCLCSMAIPRYFLRKSGTSQLKTCSIGPRYFLRKCGTSQLKAYSIGELLLWYKTTVAIKFQRWQEQINMFHNVRWRSHSLHILITTNIWNHTDLCGGQVTAVYFAPYVKEHIQIILKWKNMQKHVWDTLIILKRNITVFQQQFVLT